jgi:hypothetical protein
MAKRKKEKVSLTGAYKVGKFNEGKQSVLGFNEALETIAESCETCGCSTCYGYHTSISATTGELIAFYFTGAEGGPYTMVIEPYATAVANTKALKEARSES